MAKYILGEDFEFEEVEAEGSLPESYDLEVEMLMSSVKETESSVVFNVGVGGSVTATPLIKNDRVYFGSCDRNVYAVDLKTGREIWRFPTNGQVLAEVTISHGRIYVGSYDGNLYALNMKGGLVWKFHAGDRIASRPRVHKDRIYFTCRDGNIYVLNKQGELVWKFHTNGPLGSTPMIFKDRIYFGSFDHNLYSIDLDGKLVWKFETGDQVGGPVVEGDVIYFGSFDQCVYAVNIRGQLLWKYQTKDAIPIGTTLKVKDGVLYFGSRDYNLYAVKNGRILWKFHTNNMIFSWPLVDKGVVYFGSTDGNFYATDEKTGKELWRFQAGGPVLYSDISGDVICFGCHDTNVYAINTKGNLLWKFHTSLDYPSILEQMPEVEHTLVIPTIKVIKKRPGEKGVGKGVGDYGDFKGSYIGEDMRDYMGEPIEKGGHGMAYKRTKRIYRK
jgi:outer membrane protein assembly factor BamB